MLVLALIPLFFQPAAIHAQESAAVASVNGTAMPTGGIILATSETTTPLITPYEGATNPRVTAWLPGTGYLLDEGGPGLLVRRGGPAGD
jgi:hypothetical protein